MSTAGWPTQQSHKWGPIQDGFATATDYVIPHDHGTVTVQPVWTAEHGVSVSLDTGDEPIPRDLIAHVIAAVRLASTAPPPHPHTRND